MEGALIDPSVTYVLNWHFTLLQAGDIITMVFMMFS